MYTVTVTLVRQPARDDFGDPVGPEVRIAVAGAVVSPRYTTREDQDRGRDTVVSGLVVHVPHATDIRSTDVVEVPGHVEPDPADPDEVRPIRWLVDGDAFRRHPQVFTGRLYRTRVLLKRTEG